MAANGQAVAVSPADQIRERLDDPTVAASLNTLLDHADLLAVLVTGLDGFVRRGDAITDSLTSAVNDFKGVDAQGLTQSLVTLSNSLIAAAPALNTLLSQLGQAVAEGEAAAAADRGRPKGLFGLWKMAKDPDVARGLGFMIHVARAFGRQVGQ